MGNAPTLREYQQQAVEQLRAAIAGGKRAPILVMPTGSGKTVVAAEVMRRSFGKGKNVLFTAPRRELIWQTRAKLNDAGVPHGLLLAGAEHHEAPEQPIQVASLDTLVSRVRRERVNLPDFHLIVIDECHLGTITAAKRAVFSRWPDAYRIGLTATPTRKDGKALSALFDAIVEPVSVTALVEQGYLVPARYFSLSTPDLRGIKIKAGDYEPKVLNERMNTPKLVGDIVEHWLKHASDRRTVVFGCSIDHAVAIAEAFRGKGVRAEHVDAKTPRVERECIFARFRSGETEVLTNCFLAAYGFDLPILSCVVLARPTRSLMLYLQGLGRGLRPPTDIDAPHDCLVLDHSGAVHQHGFVADPRTWTLRGKHALVQTARTVRERASRALRQIECPLCQCVFPAARVCPECGWIFERKGRMVTTRQGTLIEVGQHVPPDQHEQMQVYLELRGYAEEQGYKKADGWAAYAYKRRFDEWPPFSWRSLPVAQPGAGVRRWMANARGARA